MPTKHRRTIHVNGHDYRWRTALARYAPHTNNLLADITLRLIVEPRDYPSSKLVVDFNGWQSIPFLWEDTRQNLAITPAIVQGVIEHATAQGWTPQTQKTFVIANAETLFTTATLLVSQPYGL